MKLYVKTESNDREYLPHEAMTRFALASHLGATSIEVNGQSYHVNEVRAVPVQFIGRAALILGGLSAVGVLLGALFLAHLPVLCFIPSFGGMMAGLYVWSKLQQQEDQRAKTFNSSRIPAAAEPSIRFAKAA
ncbi:hypothetical protein [Spirosoma migulaei]